MAKASTKGAKTGKAKTTGAKRGRPPKAKVEEQPKIAAPAPAAENTPVADIPLPSQNTLENLLEAKLISAGKVEKAIGTYRSAIAEAVNSQHLHKRAWADSVAAQKMEAEDLAIYLAHRDHYFEVLGLFTKADSVLQLPMGEPAAPAPVAQDALDGEVSPPRGNLRLVAAELAGAEAGAA